jgi:hypothetical protein
MKFLPPPPPPGAATGNVYDLDFIRANGWVQVLLLGSAPVPALQTQDPRMISLLGAAYANHGLVTVGFLPGPMYPPVITHAHVVFMPIGPGPGPGEWSVHAAEYDVATGRFTAMFVDSFGNPSFGWDDQGMAQAIVSTAVCAAEYVEYLSLSPVSEILRVKVNH